MQSHGARFHHGRCVLYLAPRPVVRRCEIAKAEIAAVGVARPPDRVGLVSNAYGELASRKTRERCVGVQQMLPKAVRLHSTSGATPDLLLGQERRPRQRKSTILIRVFTVRLFGPSCLGVSASKSLKIKR
jgi:hypothetical protein